MREMLSPTSAHRGQGPGQQASPTDYRTGGSRAAAMASWWGICSPERALGGPLAWCGPEMRLTIDAQRREIYPARSPLPSSKTS